MATPVRYSPIHVIAPVPQFMFFNQGLRSKSSSPKRFSLIAALLQLNVGACKKSARFRFWFLGFGFWVLVFGFWFLGLRL